MKDYQIHSMGLERYYLDIYVHSVTVSNVMHRIVFFHDRNTAYNFYLDFIKNEY